jgi:hypothetical protein
MSEASSLENLPLYLWIDFRCYPESKSAYTLFTTGLKSLGFMEIEIFKSRCAPSELVDAAFNVAHYLLDKGPILKDGDTIGTRVDECIRITHVKSFLERSETVYRLEM